jgi:hypothetical protein
MSRADDDGNEVAPLGSARGEDSLGERARRQNFEIAERDRLGASSCLTCRVTGTATFSAVSLYLARELLLLERSAPTRLHRAVLGAGAAGFAGLAVARWRAD